MTKLLCTKALIFNSVPEEHRPQFIQDHKDWKAWVIAPGVENHFQSWMRERDRASPYLEAVSTLLNPLTELHEAESALINK